MTEKTKKNPEENPEETKPTIVKKKRGRKPKKVSEEEKKEVKIPKKRGRKPKGGKIIEKKKNIIQENDVLPNIILHLKCKNNDNQNISDFTYNPQLELPESYNIDNNNKLESLNYQVITKTQDPQNIIKQNNQENNNIDDTTETISHKELWFKLKELQNNLHTNNNNNKKCACFWCTYDFDNPAIHIPKHFINNNYEVYGCFCSPECAVSFLMNEDIDSSVRFERYHLLNYIYGEIYNYTKNIKPAPNPYYLLDKFQGNLSINEYRNLNANDSLLLIVNKPLTRIMPELHEDNVLSSSNVSDNNYSLKRNIQRKNKSNIMNENFGF
tara:strand:+ start:746 stop:1723 length:978 start_codon:yes stop_codon:yes gene_type:complete